MSEDDVRTQLRSLGARRQAAIREQEAASAELRRVVRRAVDEGVPVTEVARLAQLSRQGIWKMLRD